MQRAPSARSVVVVVNVDVVSVVEDEVTEVVLAVKVDVSDVDVSVPVVIVVEQPGDET